MARIAAWLTAVALTGMVFHGLAVAQTGAAETVRNAAERVGTGVAWDAKSVLEADFSCTGKVQYAILGVSANEIVVAIFNRGLDQAPERLRFDADDHDIRVAKIRRDDYTLSVAEITGLSGTAPVGYKPSDKCYGVRLSDDGAQAAHIYWDHEHQRFDSWAQQ